jgi:hypothetical protein
MMFLLLVFKHDLGGQQKDSGTLKKLITENTIQINQKHVPAITMPNLCNLIFFTNNSWAVPVDHVDRRYCILETNDIMSGAQTKEKKEYFDFIGSVPIELVARWLYAMDISKFNSRMYPQTESLQDQKVRKLESVDGWWLNYLSHPPSSEDDHNDRLSALVSLTRTSPTLKLSNETDENRNCILKDTVYEMYSNHPGDISRYIAGTWQVHSPGANQVHYLRTPGVQYKCTASA